MPVTRCHRLVVACFSPEFAEDIRHTNRSDRPGHAHAPEPQPQTGPSRPNPPCTSSRVMKEQETA